MIARWIVFGPRRVAPCRLDLTPRRRPAPRCPCAAPVVVLSLPVAAVAVALGAVGVALVALGAAAVGVVTLGAART